MGVGRREVKGIGPGGLLERMYSRRLVGHRNPRMGSFGVSDGDVGDGA
jgi:hypothetical protein